MSVPSEVSISSATVTADISGSEAPAGATYTIDWGDGVQSVTSDKDTPLTHTYTRVGGFGVTLKVTSSDDNDQQRVPVTVDPVGGAVAASATSLVDRSPITVTITPPSRLGTGESVTGYSVDLDCGAGQTSTYSISAGSDLSVTEPVHCIGKVLVSVQGTLNDGGHFWLDGPTLTVTAAQPVLHASVTVTAPHTVQVDLAGCSVDFAPSSYPMFSIDWGDGTSLKNDDLASASLHQSMPTHWYTTAGTKTVTIWIGDGVGPSATTTRTITLTDPAVTATVQPVAGADRYATGVLASQRAFPAAGSAGAVVLARGDQFADALTGIPLASYRHASLLVTPGGPGATLDPRVAAEIQRVLGPGTGKTVYLLGGTAALPQGIADYITKTLHYRVVRYAGTDRYATALIIAKTGLDNPGRIVAARGDDFADALTAGPLAADKLTDASGKPAAIVLTQGPAEKATVDPATAAYIRSKERTAGAVTAVGGGAWTALQQPAMYVAGAVTGIVGGDRYGTATAVANAWGTNTQNKYTIGLATGTGFADALTGGALTAHANGPLLLTDPAVLSPATANYLRAYGTSIATIDVFGGPTAIAPTVINAVYQQLSMPY
ncbi:cell wall-binding repeat-containing protein [Catenulispora acidiphila]|uniref:cell wall-binding repeat-containing protein n=1 Tax=Catenulispora acidiphila TaxID=304895 RepID=UPI00019DE69A|nr:cell wall-binding repeat-containing protein [Catenulispora acidiphila]